MRGELDWMIETGDDVRVVKPVGRIDEGTATAFAERLATEIAAAADAGNTRLAIDLSHIEYMSSRGLRALTLGQRKSGEAGITIVLAGGNDIMREILAISRYDKVFQVYETIEQAVSA